MQVLDRKPGEGAPREDWFSTHPFSPLRVKALVLYHDSEFAKPAGTSAADLEAGVRELMGLMEPSYLEGRTKASEAMRRLLFAGAVLVGNADGAMAAEEVEVFERFFGSGAVQDDWNLEAIEASLEERMEQVRELASESQRMQLLRDLTLVARAEGYTTLQERGVLQRIARGLGLQPGVVEQILSADLEPD